MKCTRPVGFNNGPVEQTPDDQVRGQSAGGHQWKNCVLGLTNGQLRSESSVPWILRWFPIHKSPLLARAVCSPLSCNLSHPSLPKLSSLTRYKWGFDRSSLTTAGMPFRYVFIICMFPVSLVFFLFPHFFDWIGVSIGLEVSRSSYIRYTLGSVNVSKPQ